MRERGVWGPIETLNDIPLSPVIWTSVATGKIACSRFWPTSWVSGTQPCDGNHLARTANTYTKITAATKSSLTKK